MPDPTPTPDPAQNSWYSGFDQDTQAHVTAKGWDKLDANAALAAAVTAHRAAERHIGVPADQLVRLPKDATDPTYQSVYERIVGMGVPAKAEDYTFDGIRFKDGTPLDADDVAFVRDLAMKHKMPVHVARAMAADMAARVETEVATETNAIETTKAANQVALRQTWGAEFDQKSFQAARVVEALGFTPEVMSHIAALPTEAMVKNMNALVALSSQLNEAVILKGGGAPPDPSAGLDGAGAEARLAALQSDPVWAAKIMAGDMQATTERNNLLRVIAAASMPPRR